MSNEYTPEAKLFATSGNAAPEGAVCDLLTLPGSVSIRYARWESTMSPSRGTVILQHGRTEGIEKYFETAEDLRQRGFGVVTFDWRGQGGSSRMLSDPLKGHVEHFNQYLDDLDAILTQVVLPDCKPPYYLIGHSTGGLIALLAAPAISNRIDRMVLSAPFLELREIPVRQRIMKQLLGLLTYIGFGRNYVPGTQGNIEKTAFEDNRLTSDRARYARRTAIIENHRNLALSGPTIAWLYSAFRASAHVNQPGFAAAISIPTLFILAGSDRVVSTPFAESFAKRMRAASFTTIAGSRHEIFQEADVFREQALAAVDAFLPQAEAVQSA